LKIKNVLMIIYADPKYPQNVGILRSRDQPIPGPFPAFPMTKREKPWERGWFGD
jgi:hypothetical protein